MIHVCRECGRVWKSIKYGKDCPECNEGSLKAWLSPLNRFCEETPFLNLEDGKVKWKKSDLQ